MIIHINIHFLKIHKILFEGILRKVNTLRNQGVDIICTFQTVFINSDTIYKDI